MKWQETVTGNEQLNKLEFDAYWGLTNVGEAFRLPRDGKPVPYRSVRQIGIYRFIEQFNFIL